MKRIALLLLCLFILATFQLSFANSNSNIGNSSQPHIFATPEQTWHQFKAAILEGDFDTAHKCCITSRARGVLKFEKMAAEKRKRIVQSMQELKKIHLQEVTAKYKLTRNSNGSHLSTFVYFEKINDEWKIKSY